MSQQAVHANLILSRLRLRIADQEKDAKTLSTRLDRAQQQLQAVSKVRMTSCCRRHCCASIWHCRGAVGHSRSAIERIIHAIQMTQERQQLGEALRNCKDLHARAGREHAVELSKLQEQVSTSTLRHWMCCPVV